MKTETLSRPVRSLQSRFIQACIFEVGAILAISPSFHIYGEKLSRFSIKVILLLVVAIAWNAIFNHFFDRTLYRFTQSINKTIISRITYVCLFQIGLIIITTPIFFAIFHSSLWQIITADLWFSLLICGYTCITNLIYDTYF